MKLYDLKPGDWFSVEEQTHWSVAGETGCPLWLVTTGVGPQPGREVLCAQLTTGIAAYFNEDLLVKQYPVPIG